MHAVGNDFEQILSLAPEWKHAAERVTQDCTVDGAIANDLGKSTAAVFALLQKVGVPSIYDKLSKEKEHRKDLLKVIRDKYLLVLANKMFKSNGTIRRFFSERRLDSDEQKSQLTSMAVEVSLKLDSMLQKNLDSSDEKGFKVLLPAYVQTSVNNAVLDHIKLESHWERQTGMGGGTDEDGNEDNLIERTPDDLSRVPDQVILSREKVTYLNQLRPHLKHLFEVGQEDDMALVVIDCLFGLGLTKHSKLGQELTMRECCDVLKIEGETQARKIARCQVLMDKGLDKVRQILRNDLPGIVECWQQEINVNVASRRDLDHRLDLTEGEVERLVVNRQYLMLEQLVERMIVKVDRLPALKQRGAVAAFVPVDMNSCTARDMTDILGISKQVAQKIVEARPFASLDELAERKLIEGAKVADLKRRGAVLKSSTKRDLNKATKSELVASGIAAEKAAALVKSAPFQTWAELDDFLGNDEPTWLILRKNFIILGLGQNPA